MNTLDSFRGKTLLVFNTCNIKKEPIWEKMSTLGLTLVVVNEEQNWADSYVDHWIVADTSNHEQVIDRIQLFLKDNPAVKIDGVYTFCDDTVLLTSKVAEHFGLIGIPLSISSCCRNKYLFREFCEQHDINVPKHKLVKSSEDLQSIIENFSFPLVIKPIFGSGSSYVIKVENEKDLIDTYSYLQKNISQDVETALRDGRDVMVEEYINGAEADVDILLQDGTIKFIEITDNLPTREPFFIEIGDNCPTRLSYEKQEILKSMAQEVILKFGLKNACIHFEAKVTEYGAVPIELNLRMGGGDVYPYVRRVWGVDFVEYSIMIALGITFEKPGSHTPLQYMVAETIMIDTDGVITELRYDEELKQKEYLERIYLAKKVGDRVSPPPKAYDFLGWVTVSGTSYDAAKRNLEDAKRLIHCHIQPFSENNFSN